MLEQILLYGIIFLICAYIVYAYVIKLNDDSVKVKEKIKIAKEEGRFEPISLHPYIDLNSCIGSGACVTACPEQDVLGLVNGYASVINATHCIGHGACFHACPVEAITLRIGTASRGVELPHVNHNYESNVKGIYIAGELGGMGLIKNSVEQGKQAVSNIANSLNKPTNIDLDLVIVGAGPAGIAGALEAKKQNLLFEVLEQDTLGGTVFTFPREKIVMTHPMDLPLHGKVKLYNTSKDELLNLWNDVLASNNIQIKENSKVTAINYIDENTFEVLTAAGEKFRTAKVLIAIGRRGSPRKLNVLGEHLQKVAYRLLEPEQIKNKNILIVGGGDSAIESALLLMQQNKVILSYRKDKFNRIKIGNKEKIMSAEQNKNLRIIYNSEVKKIEKDKVVLTISKDEEITIENDLVFIFAGGELPTDFLKKSGIEISKKFGYVMKSHKK